uniref:Vitellogenin-1-like n=1 Tax=Geotrypetes seraphini TaxID=260995 RepID=A0A6P8NVC3_GEOSA|nr:vitellogenin-1-like [Geotrypetes seraphini]
MRGIILALMLTLAVPDCTADKAYTYAYQGSVLTGLSEKNLRKAGLQLSSKVQISGAGPNLCRLSVKPELAANIIRAITSIFQLNIKINQAKYTLQELGIGGVCQTSYYIKENKKVSQISVTKSRNLNICTERAHLVTGNTYVQGSSSYEQINKNGGASAIYNYKIKASCNGAYIVDATVHEIHQVTPFNEKDGMAVTEAKQKLELIDVWKNPPAVSKSGYQNRGSLQYHFESEEPETPIQLVRTRNIQAQVIETIQDLGECTRTTSSKDDPANFMKLAQLMPLVDSENLQSIWNRFSSRKECRPWILDAIPAIANPMAIKFIREKIEMKELSELEAAQALLMGLHLIKADRDALAEAKNTNLQVNTLEEKLQKQSNRTDNLEKLVSEIKASMNLHLKEKSLLALLTNTHLKPTSLTGKVAYLCYGSLVQRHCANIAVCPEAALQPLHDLATGAASRGNEEEMVLALKALANAGQPESLKIIQNKYLPGFSSSKIPVRCQWEATFALSGIAKKDHRRVQDIALRVYVNHEAFPVVRMVASRVLLDSNPTTTVLILMANAMLKENNLQVVTFTCSQMQALCRSVAPDRQAEASACRKVMKFISPKCDRLNYRFSHVFQLDIFKESFMAGLTSKLFVMSNVATAFPAALIANLRAHFMGVSSDLVEVGLHAEGLQELIIKRHLTSPSIKTYGKNKIMGIVKMLSGWKTLPKDKPVASVNAKFLGNELLYHKFNKDSIQYAVQALYTSEGKLPLVKKFIDQLQAGVDIHLSKSLMSAKIQETVPTCVGLPLQKSVNYVSVTKAAINAKAQISPAPTPDVSISQLLQANIKMQSKMTASMSKYIVAFMGIYTGLIQAGLEVHGKIHMELPVNFAATINATNQNLKADIAPVQEESELFLARSSAFAVTRNAEELASARMIPVVPAEIIPNMLNEPFIPGKMAAREYSGTMGILSSEIISKEVLDSTERPFHQRAQVASSKCVKEATFGYQICLESKAANAQYIKRSPLYWFCGDNYAKVIVKPNYGETSLEKIQIEFQWGSEATTRMIHLVRTENLEVYQQEITLKKLKKILNDENKSEENVDNSTDASNSSSNSSTNGLFARISSDELDGTYTQSTETVSLRRQQQSTKDSSKDRQRKKHQQELPQKGHQSSAEVKKKTVYSQISSSSSSNSDTSSSESQSSSSESSDRCSSGQATTKRPNIRIRGYNSQPSSSSSKRAKKAKHPKYPSKNISSSSSSDSSEERGMHVPEMHQLWFKPTLTHVSLFLGDAMPSGFTFVTRAIRSDGKESGYQVTAYLDSKAAKSQMQLVVVPLDAKNPWKACTECTVTRNCRTMIVFRWGQECKDHKIEAQASTGHIAGNPAIQLKMVWGETPSSMRALARRAMASAPGIGFIWGFSEIYKKNPSQQLVIRAAATSSETIDVVVKVPAVTLYKRAIPLPFSLPLGQYAMNNVQQYTSWNNLQEMTMAIATTGQDECVVSEGSLETFDKQKMECPIVSTNCYSVIAQDCTDDLQFLVSMKKVEQASVTFALNVKVGSSEIKIYPSASASLHVLFNGMLTLLKNTTYENEKEHIHIARSESAVTLEAPEFGLARITFDGETTKVTTASWMKGKTCGICGNNDGQKTNDLQKPNQEKALSCSSFVHSWVLPRSACSAGECNLKHQFVKLEKQIFNGEESTCYSTDPVLQCLKGCTPTETILVKAGFHCVPTDSAASPAVWHRSRNQKSEDIIEEVEAHTNCACSTDCTGV